MTFVGLTAPRKLSPTSPPKSKPRKPHKYQRRGVEWLVAHGGAGIFAAPGAGKTAVTLRAFKALRDAKVARRALVLCTLRVAYKVWPIEAEAWAESEWANIRDLKICLLHGPKKNFRLADDADIYVINFDGLKWLLQDHAKEFAALKIDTLVVDECFTRDTLVNTPQGMLKIGTLKAGDLVYTEVGPREVLRVTERAPKGVVVKLQLSNGKTITTTEDHPFFTEVAWLPAKYLSGRRLLCLTEVSNLQREVQGFQKSLSELSLSADLLHVLLAEGNVGAWRREDETALFACYEKDNGEPRQQLEQRDGVEQRSTSENIGNTKGARTPPLQWPERWEWAPSGARGNQSAESAAKELYTQLSNKLGRQAAWLSYQLQSGFWRSFNQDSYRSRRAEPPRIGPARAGREEGSQAEGTWVESVTYLEPGSVPTVFNLEVKGCPHFEVEGCALVHNSTKLKHTNTKRFKLLKPYLPTFARRWILTGKPIPRSYLDLFGQLYVVDLGYSLGRYITHFRNQYFTPLDRFGWSWVLQKDAEVRIQERIAPYIFQLEPGDYKEIPIVENVIRVDLPPEARKVYDQLEDELLVQLGEHTVTAVSSGVAAGKCAQVANGGLYHNASELNGAPRTWTDIHEAKTEAVVELVEELQGSPAIIVYEFKHDLLRLKKVFPDAPYVGGKVSGLAGHAALDEKDPTVDKWNRDEIPILLAHAASLAHGLNLQYGTARNVIWHSITYDREFYDQLNMRLARQGQTASSVFSHFIVAVNTVDEPKMRALKKKGKVQENFLSALREYAKERR